MINFCDVPNCGLKMKAKGFCNKHYKTLSIGGDPYIDGRVGPRALRFPCKVQGCTRYGLLQGLCTEHNWELNTVNYAGIKNRKRGEGAWKGDKGYIRIYTGKGYVFEHDLLAEKALGKPLPKGAVVHHMNEIKDDNFTPFNLVICSDQAYHLLLHERARQLRAKEINTLDDLFKRSNS